MLEHRITDPTSISREHMNEVLDQGSSPTIQYELDQLQRRSISFDGAGLEEISLHNCKNLEHLNGLLKLKRLRAFRISRTKPDLDSLVDAKWPDSMESAAIYGNSEKWNKHARQVLDEKGYREVL